MPPLRLEPRYGRCSGAATTGVIATRWGSGGCDANWMRLSAAVLG
jgi:hypothetical protein